VALLAACNYCSSAFGWCQPTLPTRAAYTACRMSAAAHWPRQAVQPQQRAAVFSMRQNMSETTAGWALAAAAAAVLAVGTLGLGVLMGWDLALVGSADNRGLGVPLSTEEAAQLSRAGDSTTRAGGDSTAPNSRLTDSDGGDPSLEELREEQALLDVIRGVSTRAR